jgi:hypothetical protein
MNTERDKFLTEAMGGCWHDFSKLQNMGFTAYLICDKCGATEINETTNFSTWGGFGKLWEWSQKQEWWTMFCFKMKDQIDWDIDDFLNHHINPDRFADAVYEFVRVQVIK